MINFLLNRVGLQIRRVPRKARLVARATASELAAIDRIFVEFTSRFPPTDPLANLQAWKKYLSEARISLFHNLLHVVRDHGMGLDGQQIADFGSGTGYLLRLIEQQHQPAQLVGFDSFLEANQLAKMMCPSAQLHASLQETATQYDRIFCTEVLEHLTHPAEQIQQLTGRLNPGGCLIATVPDGRTDTSAAKQSRADGTGYWGHIHFWSPESWPLFLNGCVGDNANITTGILACGKNYALIQPVH